MDNTTNTSEPNGSPPRPIPVIVRLSRVRAVVDTLSDALEGDGEYSPHIERRCGVCDLLSLELGSIAEQIEREDTP